MKTVLLVASAASALAASAHSGFLGFVASTRTSGTYTIIDVFAAVSNSSDKFLNVYNAQISTTLPGGFYQENTLANRGWRPDTTNFTSTRASIDSFMTAGAYRDPSLPIIVYAGTNTAADPNFTGSAWIGTADASSVPSAAGWYSTLPTSSENNAESLAGLVGRVDSVATPGSGSTAGSVGSAGAQWGIWVAHLVVATKAPIVFGTNMNFFAAGGVRDGVTGALNQGYSVIPAPGALALLGLSGISTRRRRR